MKFISIALIAIISFNWHNAFAGIQFNNNGHKNPSIVVEVRLPKTFDKEKAKMQFAAVDFVGKMQWKSADVKVVNGSIKWIITSSEPHYLFSSSIFKSWKYFNVLVEPGDNVIINSEGDKLRFSGKGSEKFKLKYEMYSMREAIQKPKNHKDYVTNSLEDYYEWNEYLNKQLELVVPLIDSYKNNLSPFAYGFIRTSFIDQNIDDRSDKIYSLEVYAKKLGLTNKNLCDIYDSTYYPATEKWFQYTSSKLYGNWKPILYKVKRKFLFDNDKEPLNSREKTRLAYYEEAINTYKGLIREKFIVDYFPTHLIQKLGFFPEAEKLLAQYYAEPGYPEYKKYMKDFELQQRELINGRNAPDFTLTDVNGKPFTKENIKGKIAVFDFWFTGCAGCIQMAPALQKVEQEFKNDTNVVFVSINVDEDKNQWLKSVAQKKYTSGNGVNVYTGGEGSEHDMLKKYAVDGYPALWLMDPQGRIIRTFPKPDPRNDNGKRLIELLHKQLSYLKDGPYVMYDDDVSMAYSINGDSLVKARLTKANSPVFNVQTDQNKCFSVSLKSSLSVESSDFTTSANLLVFSDIEGNFDAFRKLLQANRVIDENYNWTFGRNHLVFAGDMFDRGQQVTECLWLIYSLEEKAKRSGGYVHFILGNHEIMNLKGDHRYTQQKYKDNAMHITKSLKELYGENSELGRWLRTKNVIERINDLLFVHGGISREVAKLSLSIQQMNEFIRLNIDEKESQISDTAAKVLLSTRFSPYWFRDYYEQGEERDPRIIKMAELDEILGKFNVKKIITGHTIISDTISAWYNNKIINTDTKHAEGKSEALLIDGVKYYRVNANGNRVLLMNLQKDGEYTKK